MCVLWEALRAPSSLKSLELRQKGRTWYILLGQSVYGVIEFTDSSILIWFGYYFLGFFWSVAIFNFPLNNWIHYLSKVLWLECSFFWHFFLRISLDCNSVHWQTACRALSVSLQAHCRAAQSQPGLLIHHGHGPPHSLSLGRGLWGWQNALEEEAEGGEELTWSPNALAHTLVCGWRVGRQRAWVESGTWGCAMLGGSGRVEGGTCVAIQGVRPWWPALVTDPGEWP